MDFQSHDNLSKSFRLNRISSVFKADRKAKGGLIILLFFLCAAFFAPWLSPYDPNEMTLNMMSAPSWQHFLGTDELGRDLLLRIV